VRTIRRSLEIIQLTERGGYTSRCVMRRNGLVSLTEGKVRYEIQLHSQEWKCLLFNLITSLYCFSAGTGSIPCVVLHLNCEPNATFVFGLAQ
jgi:hypothetical protein